jgi:hypothetical protein
MNPTSADVKEFRRLSARAAAREASLGEGVEPAGSLVAALQAAAATRATMTRKPALGFRASIDADHLPAGRHYRDDDRPAANVTVLDVLLTW